MTAYTYVNQPGFKRLSRITNAFNQMAGYYYDPQGRLSEDSIIMNTGLSYNFWTYDPAGRVPTLGTCIIIYHSTNFSSP